MPDAWEQANGGDLTANAYDLDPEGYYTNIEVYANWLVEDIMAGGNSDAESTVEEYYPAGIKGDKPEETPTPNESNTYTVAFNGKDSVSTAGYFYFGDGDAKHNFNTKFKGTYGDMKFTQGLKMEGSTLVAFTATYLSTVTIVQSTWSNYTIKFDDEELDVASATTPTGSSGVRVYTLTNVAAGEHRITRGNGESGLFFVEVNTAPVILGDVNGNGQVDIGDAVTIVNYLVGKTNATFIEQAADTNKNGDIDIGDAVTIVNILVGKDNGTLDM